VIVGRKTAGKDVIRERDAWENSANTISCLTFSWQCGRITTELESHPVSARVAYLGLQPGLLNTLFISSAVIFFVVYNVVFRSRFFYNVAVTPE
jgi:hypothetical protein